jgi:hypothetical protein
MTVTARPTPCCLPRVLPLRVYVREQLGCRSRRLYAEDAVAAVRAKNIQGAVFCYVAAGKLAEAVDAAVKDFYGGSVTGSALPPPTSLAPVLTCACFMHHPCGVCR